MIVTCILKLVNGARLLIRVECEKAVSNTVISYLVFYA